MDHPTTAQISAFRRSSRHSDRPTPSVQETVAGHLPFVDLGFAAVYYPALAGLLRAVGRTFKPKVFCVLEGADQGAGHPDYALYTARQVQKGRPRKAQIPERGVVEVKGVEDDAWLTAKSEQVSRYWGRYGLVLVTNLRDFVLVGADGSGSPAKLETLRLAEDADDFWSKVEKPRAFAREVGAELREVRAARLDSTSLLNDFLRGRRSKRSWPPPAAGHCIEAWSAATTDAETGPDRQGDVLRSRRRCTAAPARFL